MQTVFNISEEKEHIVFKRNRLILQNSLTQFELVQIKIAIKQRDITEPDWLAFTGLKNTDYAKKSTKFIQHKVLERMNLCQVLMNKTLCS